MEDHKEFLNPKLDFTLVHYIEKRAGNGDTIDDIRHDLLKGHKKAAIETHLDYVNKHKTQIYLHSLHWQLIFFGVGLFLVLVVAAAIWYYLR